MDKAKEVFNGAVVTLESVRGHPYAEPAATAMKLTGTLLIGIGTLVPVVGVVGGAMKMGSKGLTVGGALLAPKASRKDVMDMGKNVTEMMEGVKAELDAEVKGMRMEMAMIAGTVGKIKEKVDMTFKIVRDQRYKDGMEKIEAFHANFVKWSHNLDEAINHIKPNIGDIEMLYEQNLNVTRLKEYLRIIRFSEGSSYLQCNFDYAIYLKGLFLQLMVIYHTYNGDIRAMTQEFERFNDDLLHLQQFMREMEAEEEEEIAARIANLVAIDDGRSETPPPKEEVIDTETVPIEEVHSKAEEASPPASSKKKMMICAGVSIVLIIIIAIIIGVVVKKVPECKTLNTHSRGKPVKCYDSVCDTVYKDQWVKEGRNKVKKRVSTQKCKKVTREVYV